jgi:hypothetical protein
MKIELPESCGSRTHRRGGPLDIETAELIRGEAELRETTRSELVALVTAQGRRGSARWVPSEDGMPCTVIVLDRAADRVEEGVQPGRRARRGPRPSPRVASQAASRQPRVVHRTRAQRYSRNYHWQSRYLAILCSQVMHAIPSARSSVRARRWPDHSTLRRRAAARGSRWNLVRHAASLTVDLRPQYTYPMTVWLHL